MSNPESHGCVHLVFKGGKFKSVLFHLENTEELPENCVVHLKADHIQSYDEFKKAHPEDAHEVE